MVVREHGRELKSRIVTLCILVLLVLVGVGSKTPVHAFDQGFGSTDGFAVEDGFGDAAFGDMSEINEDFFVHDTLEKLLLLLAFSLVSIVIYYKARFLRTLLLVTSVLVLGMYMSGFLCPLAAVQNIFQKYHTAFLLIFLVPIILAITMGRLFCGYICPFGAIQELLQVQKWQMSIPTKYIHTMQKLKYFLLMYLVIRVVATSNIIGVGHSPFGALFRFGGTTTSIVITLLIGLLSIFIYRPFCQFICPLGACLGLTSLANKKSPLPAQCTGCNQCTKHCKIAAISKGRINKSECLLCGQCADSCWIPKSKHLKANSS